MVDVQYKVVWTQRSQNQLKRLFEFISKDYEQNALVILEEIVLSINKVTEGGSISLDTGDAMASIICEFENQVDIANVKVGDKVKVKGFCTGMLMDVVLSRCSL